MSCTSPGTRTEHGSLDLAWPRYHRQTDDHESIMKVGKGKFEIDRTAPPHVHYEDLFLFLMNTVIHRLTSLLNETGLSKGIKASEQTARKCRTTNAWTLTASPRTYCILLRSTQAVPFFDLVVVFSKFP